MNDHDRQAFERLLHDHIPLAAAMQAGIDSFDGEALTARAPLAANRNHYGTAFGGSIYTVSLLAGWGLTSLLVGQAGMIVVEHAEADYKRPIKEDLVATARPAEGADPATFAAAFHAHGKARLAVTVRMDAAGQTAFVLNAHFAARR